MPLAPCYLHADRMCPPVDSLPNGVTARSLNEGSVNLDEALLRPHKFVESMESFRMVSAA
jgi:hypothetical protein